MHPIVTPAPLQSLREQLDQCRSIGKRAVFPEELKRQAIKLSSEYPPTAVVNALAISPTSLSRWKRQLDDEFNSSVSRETNEAFVALPAAQAHQTKRYQLSIVLGSADSDHSVTFTGKVTWDKWREILDNVSEVLLP